MTYSNPKQGYTFILSKDGIVVKLPVGEAAKMPTVDEFAHDMKSAYVFWVWWVKKFGSRVVAEAAEDSAHLTDPNTWHLPDGTRVL